MAAPTQELPPWLSFVTTTITDAGGNPLATSTTLQYLPLTYYGPSIPLGSLWSYGGLTSPASTSPSPSETGSSESITTSAIPTTLTTSAIPTTLSSTSSAISPSTTSASTSASPTSVTTSPPTSSVSITSSIPSSAPSSSPTAALPPSSVNNALTKGQLIGVIVASILGFIFLFVLALFIYLWCIGRARRREQDGQPPFSMVTPIDEDYQVVGAGGHTPGEGSPRHSGEEADPFLQRSAAGPSTAPQMQQANVRRIPPPVIDASVSSSGGSSSAASGYGTLLERPSLNVNVIPPEERRGNILTPDELRRLDDETVLPHNTDFANTDFGPLMPPPRLVDPAATSSFSSLHRPSPSRSSLRSSFPADADEDVTLLTARRVRVEDLGPRSQPQSPDNVHADLPAQSSNRMSWKGLGLAGLAGTLGRLSWFRNLDDGSSSSRRNSHVPSWRPASLSEHDIEAGRALLGAGEMSESRNSRGLLGVGLGPGGSRPISSVSTRASGSTVYHDAQSDSSEIPPPLPTPPPRALASPAQAETGMWPSGDYLGQPPMYDDHLPESTVTSGPSTINLPQGVDILDMPAPRGISPFTSSTSLRETATNSSIGSKTSKSRLPFPPGLGGLGLSLLPTPAAWDATTGSTPSPGSFAAASVIRGGGGHAQDASMDVLEEEPPSTVDGWRTLAGVVGNPDEAGRRTTFGLPQYVHSPDYTSEAGSLHSMRSHLSPHSSRSAGSASAARRDLSGSSSSRPSAHSSASVSGLSHSGSITSDGRLRRNRVTTGPISPALSAFGHPSPLPAPKATLPNPSLLSPLGPSGHYAAIDGAGGQVSVDGPSGSHSPVSPRLSPLPWAGGLDHDWTPT